MGLYGGVAVSGTCTACGPDKVKMLRKCLINIAANERSGVTTLAGVPGPHVNTVPGSGDLSVDTLPSSS